MNNRTFSKILTFVAATSLAACAVDATNAPLSNPIESNASPSPSSPSPASPSSSFRAPLAPSRDNAPDAGTSPAPAASSADASAADATNAARPSASTTGPTDPARLVASGAITVTTDGTVLRDVDVTGEIKIAANNVTVQNFRVRATSFYALQIVDGFTGTHLEDGELDGKGITSALLYGGDFVAERLDIHSSGTDAIKLIRNATIEASWIHEIGMQPNVHADGIQIVSGSHFVARANFFDLPIGVAGYNPNSAVFVKEDNGPIDDVLVDSNWLNGGNYTVYSATASTSNATATNVRATNNLFGRSYRFGTHDGAFASWTNDRWMDTGAAIAQ